MASLPVCHCVWTTDHNAQHFSALFLCMKDKFLLHNFYISILSVAVAFGCLSSSGHSACLLTHSLHSLQPLTEPPTRLPPLHTKTRQLKVGVTWCLRNFPVLPHSYVSELELVLSCGRKQIWMALRMIFKLFRLFPSLFSLFSYSCAPDSPEKSRCYCC